MNITQLDVGYNIIASTSHLLVQPRISWLQTVLIVSPISEGINQTKYQKMHIIKKKYMSKVSLTFYYFVIIRKKNSNKISKNEHHLKKKHKCTKSL